MLSFSFWQNNSKFLVLVSDKKMKNGRFSFRQEMETCLVFVFDRKKVEKS